MTTAPAEQTGVPPIVLVPQTPVARAAGRPARRRVDVDTSGKFGPVTGPVAAGLGVLAIGSVGHVAHLAPAFGIFAGGLVGLFDFIWAWCHKHTPTAMAYRWVAFVLAGCWLFAAWQWSPWRTATLVPLAVVAGGMARIAFLAARRRSEEELAARRAAEAAALHGLDARARDWEQRIVRVGGGKQWEGVRIANIADWENGDGFTLDGDCPPGGNNWRDLASMAVGLAADARLPNGCDIEAAEGVHQAAFLLHVPTRDTFSDYKLTDDAIVPASVMNGIDLGVTRTRDRAVIPIRESATAIVSDTGGGKTTLLHRIVLKLTLCTDGIPVLIDMNNGDMGRAWCEAWWDGEAPHPVVGAIAGDAVEAYLLTKFFVGVALGRKKRSGPLKMAANQSLMPIGNGAPGQPPSLVVPIYDESAELVGVDAAQDDVEGLGEDEVRDLIKRTMAASEKTLRVARDAGIRPIYSAIKATDDFLPTSLLALCRNRIGLHLPTDADHGVLFGWTKGEKASSGPVRKGVGLYALGHNQPTTAFAAPDMTPQQIREYSIVIANAGIGPWDLTAEDIADGEAYAGEGVWTRRWERAEKLFGRPRRAYETKETVMAESEPESTEERPVRPVSGGGFKEVFDGLDRIQADLDAVLNDDPASDRLTVPAAEPVEDDAAEIARLTALWEAPAYEEPTPDRPATETRPTPARTWQERVLQLLDQAGPAGAAPTPIADKVYAEWGTTRQTVNTWLSDEAKRSDAGDVTSLVVRPSRGRYVHRRHVQGGAQ